MIRRIAILGEFGTGNLGDDLGYVLLRDELYRAFDELDVLVSIYPLSGQAGLDMATWHAIVTGCGTLLDEVRGNYITRLLLADCPIAILGTGTVDQRYAMPTPGGVKSLENVLRLSSYTWRRGVEGPDPGWLMGWRRPEGVEPTGYCGINEGPAAHNLAPLSVEALHDLRSRLGRPNNLVAAFPADLDALKPLRRPDEEILLVDGTRRSCERVSYFSAMYCRRIHLAVLAACCGVHPVLLDYSAKVQRVFTGTDVVRTVLPTASTVATLAAALNEDLPAPTRESVEAAQADCRVQVRAAAAALAAEWERLR